MSIDNLKGIKVGFVDVDKDNKMSAGDKIVCEKDGSKQEFIVGKDDAAICKLLLWKNYGGENSLPIYSGQVEKYIGRLNGARAAAEAGDVDAVLRHKDGMEALEKNCSFALSKSGIIFVVLHAEERAYANVIDAAFDAAEKTECGNAERIMERKDDDGPVISEAEKRIVKGTCELKSIAAYEELKRKIETNVGQKKMSDDSKKLLRLAEQIGDPALIRDAKDLGPDPERKIEEKKTGKKIDDSARRALIKGAMDPILK